MRVYHEEIFGPVAPVTFVDSADQAVTVTNDTHFGLSAGILTSDYDRGLAIAASLNTGMAHAMMIEDVDEKKKKKKNCFSYQITS